MAARRPFWKRHRWKSIGFCLWPPSTCIWSLKLKFQSKLDLCSGNHVVYRQTDGQTDRRTDGQGESSIPPLQLRWAGVQWWPSLAPYMNGTSIWWVNSLWPSDAIWRHRSMSTLAQVMACCLTAPSHYLNQCWLMIREVLWHSPDSNFTENT